MMEPVNVSVLEDQEMQFPGQKQQTFESHNYYDVYITLLKNHEELLNRARVLERENIELQELLDRASQVLDKFRERIIRTPVQRMKYFVNLSNAEEFIYMAIDFKEEIKWLKNEEEFKKWCADQEGTEGLGSC